MNHVLESKMTSAAARLRKRRLNESDVPSDVPSRIVGLSNQNNQFETEI